VFGASGFSLDISSFSLAQMGSNCSVAAGAANLFSGPKMDFQSEAP
jgi:hypothetical protein